MPFSKPILATLAVIVALLVLGPLLVSFAPTVLIFLGVLAFLILIHEMGHFFTAKAMGIKVHEFGLGFPPRLLGVRRGETIYTLNLLPLGGFVKLAGEDNPNDDPDPRRNFAARPPWQRFIVLVAGAGMNAALPFVLFAIVALVPHEVLKGPVVVQQVAENSPAAAAGIQPGDVVVRADGRPVRNHGELGYLIQLNLGAETDWVLQRDGTTRTVTVVPRWRPPQGQGAVGVIIGTGLVSATDVAPGSNAAALGLRPGDVLLGINNINLPTAESFSQVLDLLAEQGDKTATLTVLRGGELVRLPVDLTRPKPASALQGAGLVAAPPARESEPLWRAVPAGAQRTIDVLVLAKNEVYRWIIGSSVPEVAGPIGIAQMTGEVARAGFLPLLEFTALLSINLAILNILPIPALDGGRTMFVVFEWVTRGRRIPPEKEGLVHLVGFVALLLLAVLVSYMDIQRLLEGGSLLR